MYHLTCVKVCECVSVFLLPECPNMVATHSPVLNSKMLMFLSEQLVATYWPDGSSCTCENKRARKESTLCANMGKQNSQQRYPDQASILAQRSFVELLLFTTVDVKNPACRGKGWPQKLTNYKILAGTTRENTYLMQRSWQPTAAYLQVGSTPMS